MASRGERFLPWLLVLPAFAILVPFHLWPALEVLRLSFIPDAGASAFSNYREVAQSGELGKALSVTIWFALGTVPLSIGIGFCAAWWIHRARFFQGILRTLYFLPAVTSAFTAALIWRWIFDPNIGLLRAFLEGIGVRVSSEFLLDAHGILEPLGIGVKGPSVALCCVMAYSVWHSLGFETLVILAALSIVPRDYFEAADIEGASGFRLHRLVTLPLISPTLFFLAILGTIRALQAFTPLYLLTRDGAQGTTVNLPYLVFKKYWDVYLVGEACALAVILFGLLAAISWIQRRTLESRVHYG